MAVVDWALRIWYDCVTFPFIAFHPVFSRLRKNHLSKTDDADRSPFLVKTVFDCLHDLVELLTF